MHGLIILTHLLLGDKNPMFGEYRRYIDQLLPYLHFFIIYIFPPILECFQNCLWLVKFYQKSLPPSLKLAIADDNLAFPDTAGLNPRWCHF